MSLPVSSLLPPAVAPASPLGGVSPSGGSGAGASFASMLTDAVQQVDALRANANQGVERFLAGEDEELHRTVLEVQKADLAFDLFLQVRNKVVQAYQEVMRMQV